MTQTSLPHRLVAQLGWTNRVQSVTRLAPGFSGAVVYRVSVLGLGDFAVKRFPAGTNASRLNDIHHSIAVLHQNGVNGLPVFQRGKSGSVLTTANDHRETALWLWEATTWQTGEPLCVDADVNRIAEGAKAIARFHRIAMTLPSRSVGIPPSVTQRIERLSTITADMPSPTIVSQRYLDDVGESDPVMRNQFTETLTEAMSTLRQGWPNVGNDLQRQLLYWSNQPVDCCFVMRDIHRDHALFDGQQVRFIDFDAGRVDTPAIDLARWIGSFQSTARSDNDAIFKAAMAEYAKEHPSRVSTNVELTDLVRALQHSGTWGSLANWVNWVNQGRQFDSGLAAVCSRIRSISDAARMLLRS